MKEERIIKGLECCATAYDCSDCPFECDCGSMQNLKTATVDLINRQKAEIERLQKEKFDSLNCQFAEMYSTTLNIAVKKAKSEAVKEFEKKMNKMLFMDDYSTKDIKAKMKAVKKEMVGDDK